MKRRIGLVGGSVIGFVIGACVYVLFGGLMALNVRVCGEIESPGFCGWYRWIAFGGVVVAALAILGFASGVVLRIRGWMRRLPKAAART